MIEVAGHTDSTGSEAKNFRLSRERADAVVQTWRSIIDSAAADLLPNGLPERTEAVADNSTAGGRAQNRLSRSEDDS